MNLARAFAVVTALWAALPAVAEPEAARLAEEAAEALGAAAEALAEAERSSDRIQALTQTIRAYETGLSAMREGLRQAVVDEREQAGKLSAADSETGALLAVLQGASVETRARTVLHPGGTIDGLRAGMLAASVVPALEARAADLERELTDLVALRLVREAGVQVLQDGLASVRDARLALSRAMSERTSLPPEVATDAAAMEALINSSETLSAFADSLAREEVSSATEPGSFETPVFGKLLRGFNEADASGSLWPGWVVAARHEALVTAPSDATVRFSGEVPGSGQVVILETDPGQMVILSGLGTRFVRTSEIVSSGDPVGLMGGNPTATQEKLNESSLLGGQPWAETLYIEIRQGQEPVDPAAFFRPLEN